MATPPNRYPSPLPTRPRTSKEPDSAARRSFGATPSPIPLGRRGFCNSCPPSPSNSPADSVRRGLRDKEEMTEPWDCSEKENERAAKLRSPAKGSKNFMSPTISAASKFSPSLKKKVLVERNEPVRTSISLCDGKATFFSSISSDPTENSVPKTEIHPSTRSPRKVTFSEAPLHDDDDDDTNVTSSDSRRNETCLTFPWPVLSSCMNHTSPRPQFTLYSPKPRPEFLNGMKRGFEMVGEPKQLDESFVSAIVSDDSDSESQIEDFHYVSDDSSSTTEEEIAEEEEPKSSLEEEIVMIPEAEELLDNENPEGEKKNGIFICLKWAFSVFLLLMVAACVVSISVTDRRPVLDGYGVKDVNLADLSSYRGSQVQSTLNDHHLGWFSIPSSLSTYELSPLLFTNSTCLIGGAEWEFKVDRVLEEEQDQELDNEAESEGLDEEDNVEEEADSDYEEKLEDEDDVPETELGGKVEVEDVADEEEDVGSAEEDEISAFGAVAAAKDELDNPITGTMEISVLEDDVLVELDSPPINGDVVQSEEVHSDFADTMESSVLEAVEDDVLVELDSPFKDVLQPEEEEEEEEEVPTDFFDDNSKISALEEAVGEGELDVGIHDNIADEKDGSFSLGILSSPFLLISTATVAIAAAVFTILAKQNNRTIMGKDEKQETMVNDDGETSWEVSSNSSSTSRRRRRGRRTVGGEEAEERRKEGRRESVATTSADYSLGSFTTYEKIPFKHLGNNGGTDEGMTPVRRSSRIRSQVVTSPS